MEYWPLILRYILFATPQAILIIMCVKYLKKVKSSDAKLLASGSIITFISYTFSTFLYLLIPLQTFEPYTLGLIGGVFNFTNAIGPFLFAFGFLVLIKKYLKKKETEEKDEVDSIGKH